MSYLDLLENRAIPSIIGKIQRFLFMQDNARPHTKKESRDDEHSLVYKLLTEKHGIEMVNWPANSCDLNPQENVWSMLDKIKEKEIEKRARKNNKSKTLRVPKNKKEMFALLKECWNKLDNEAVRNAYFSFLNRLEKVQKINGGNNYNLKTTKRQEISQ